MIVSKPRNSGPQRNWDYSFHLFLIASGMFTGAVSVVWISGY